MDARAGFEDGFRAGLGELFRRHPRELEFLTPQVAYDLGRAAARSAVAPALWQHQIGDVWDTTKVTTVLGVTRQSLNERLHRGSLLGFRAGRSTVYPAWQFDESRRSIRKVVPMLLGIFREVPGFDPLTVASWATSPQSELQGERPAELLEHDPENDWRVVEAARHTAATLAQ